MGRLVIKVSAHKAPLNHLSSVQTQTLQENPMLTLKQSVNPQTVYEKVTADQNVSTSNSPKLKLILTYTDAQVHASRMSPQRET